MLIFIRIFRAELIKTNRTYGLLISIIIPLFISLLQFLIFYFKHEYFAEIGMNPWEIMGSNLFSILGIIVMPMYIVIISYLINFTEHQSNSWKYLFALPISKLQIYAAKMVMTLFWLFIFCIILCVVFLINGQLLSILRPDIGFQDYNVIIPFLISMLKLFFSGFGILALQFFFSIYWKDFIRPVGIGLGLTIAGFILSSWDYVFLIPYAQPYLIRECFTDLNTDILTNAVLFSFLYFLVFFQAGYFLVSKQEV